jgi:hypothetical protein
MMDMKLTNQDILRLFFRIPGPDKDAPRETRFELPAISDKKLKRVQKFLKHFYYQDEKEVYTATDKLYGALPENRFFKEEFMLAEIADLFVQRKLKVDKVAENIQAWLDDELIDFDMLAYGDKHAVVINLYSTIESNEIDEFVDDLVKFKTFFKEYANHKVVGAIGVLDISAENLKYAFSKGLYVMKKNGEFVTTVNKKTFKPTTW